MNYKPVYLKHLQAIGKNMVDYTTLKNLFSTHNIDLSYISHKGFRLFAWIRDDANCITCWINDDLMDLFDNPDFYIKSMLQ